MVIYQIEWWIWWTNFVTNLKTNLLPFLSQNLSLNSWQIIKFKIFLSVQLGSNWNVARDFRTNSEKIPWPGPIQVHHWYCFKYIVWWGGFNNPYKHNPFQRWANNLVFKYYLNSCGRILVLVFVFGWLFKTEYYLYSNSGNFLKPNIICISIRVIFQTE